MKRKTIASLLITVMTISLLMSGCGLFKSADKNSETVDNDTEIESEISTETESEIESEISTESQAATNESEPKPSEPTTPTTPTTPAEPQAPVHTCNFATLKTDANNHWLACSCGNTANMGAHGYDDEYDANCNTCGFTRSVPQRPAAPEASTNPGNVSWNGGDIYLSNVGMSIPTLEEFNNVGLVPGQNNWWTGAEGDKKALSDMNRIYLTCDTIMETLGRQGVSQESVNGFTVSQGAIWWSWNGADNHYFELTRDRVNGYYVLTINQSLKDAPYGQYNLANWNKDIVKYLCTIVSSEPETLYNYIYDCIYGSSPIYDSKYITVGDCKLKMDKYFIIENEDIKHVKFYIAPR